MGSLETICSDVTKKTRGFHFDPVRLLIYLVLLCCTESEGVALPTSIFAPVRFGSANVKYAVDAR
jgi:hypothetical protein